MKVACKGLTLTFLFLVLGLCVLSFLPSRAEGASGWQIDLFCQYGGVGKNVACAVPFAVGNRIILYAYVSYNQEPVQSVLVAFQADKPNGSPLLFGAEETNASGIATTNFTISVHSYPTFPSWWNSTATTSPAQDSVSDNMPFEVLPTVVVGGISISTPPSAVNICTWTVLVEIQIGLVLIIFATIRKRKN